MHVAIHGVLIENYQKKMALALKRCIFDHLLVTPKYV